ncbi:MMPL family transporter [Herbidospora sp. RD11066]
MTARTPVIVVWALVALASLMSLPGLLERLVPPSLQVPGAPSAEAARVVAAGFPGLGDEQMMLAFTSPTLTSDDVLYQRALVAVVQDLGDRPEIGDLRPLPAVAAQDPGHVYVLVGVRGGEQERRDLLPGQRRVAQEAAQRAAGGAVEVSLTGSTAVFTELAGTDVRDLRVVELVTVPVVLVLLAFGLGSLRAALIPLAVAGAAVLAGLGALAAAGRVDTFMVTVTVTVCLGLGLDYALLLLLRHRQARRDGMDDVAAAAHAVRTAGVTVSWCALVVVLTAAGLFVVPAPQIRGIAGAAILATVVTVAAALTLAPALLARGVPIGRTGENPRWARWATHLMRHPWRYTLAVTALLAIAALPAAWATLGLRYDRSVLAGTDAGAGLARMEADGLAGFTLLALPHPPGPPVDTAPLTAALRADPRVSAVAALDNGRDLTLITVAERHPADHPEAAALLARYRQLAPRGLVAGPAAQLDDLTRELGTRVWQVAGVVLAGSFTLLMVLFRSLLIPLKAIAMNVLTVAATFGLLSLAFDGRIGALVPLLTFSLVFGLSMDYEVFLAHRVTEHWRRTGDTPSSVVYGLRHTAHAITLAAATIAVTFGALMFTHREDIRQTGFAVAVAIVIDVTLIRMVLVPALMRLFGRWNWFPGRPVTSPSPAPCYELELTDHGR